MATKIVFAGFGGQGVQFVAKVTAYAGMIANKEVSWLPSYGPEMRGDTSNCSVCIDDSPIACPIVNEPDILMALNTLLINLNLWLFPEEQSFTILHLSAKHLTEQILFARAFPQRKWLRKRIFPVLQI